MLQVIWTIPLVTRYTPDGIPIYGFGLMLFLAFILCTWLASRRAPAERILQRGTAREMQDTVQDLAIWILLGGLIGARLVSIYTSRDHLPTFSEVLYELPRIWQGGIVLYGAVLGGVVGFYLAYFLIYRRKGLHVFRFLDTVAPAIALGLVLGRFGCFLNGCCYGQVACVACLAVTPIGFPMSAPPREDLVLAGAQTAAGFTVSMQMADTAGVKVDKVDPGSPAHAAGLRSGAVITELNGQSVRGFNDLHNGMQLAGWPKGQRSVVLTFIPRPGAAAVTETIWPTTLGLYPTQLYEVVSMFLLFLVLLAYYPLRHNPGQLTALLMVAYGLHRFLNELLRDDPRPKGFEAYGSVLLIAGGAFLWAWLAMQPREPEPPPPEPEPTPDTQTGIRTGEAGIATPPAGP